MSSTECGRAQWGSHPNQRGRLRGARRRAALFEQLARR